MRHLSIVATPFALALLLSACGPKTEQTADATGNAITTTADNVGDAIANAADDVKDAVTPTPTGQEFVDRAAKSDAFEIASAKLAIEKAASADLKKFAAMMIDDHTASTAKVKKAAAEAGVTPNATLTDDQNARLADLGKLAGADFDKEYASQQVDAHQSALTLLTIYAERGEVPSLKTAAGEIKPKVQAHLDTIKTIRATFS